MLKHLFKVLWNERKHNLGLLLELLLVAVCFWFITDSVFSNLKIYHEPMGVDIEHTYRIVFDQYKKKSLEYTAPGEEGYITYAEALIKAKERLSLMPEVEATSLSWNSIPHMGNNTSQYLKHDTMEIRSSVMLRQVTSDFIRVYGYHNEKGETQPLVDALERDEVILPKNVVEQLYHNGEQVIGSQISFLGDSTHLMTVGGVCQVIKQNNFWNWNKSMLLPFPENKIAELGDNSYVSRMEFSVRVKPEADHNFKDYFMKEIAPKIQNGNLYVTDLVSINDMKQLMNKEEMNEIQLSYFVLLFFAVNIFLGVIGVFWYRTEYRIHEIGVRMALGDRPNRLLSMYIGEGLLLLFITLPFAALVMGGIMKLELVKWYWFMNASRFLIGMAFTYIILSLMIVVGIWFPAHKAVNIPPSEALNDE